MRPVPALSPRLTRILGEPLLPATSVASGVAMLSRLFTSERSALPPRYLDDASMRAAYLAYYLPVNLAKIRFLLEELPSEARIAASPDHPLTVLDVGAGPGSGALAVLDWVIGARAEIPSCGVDAVALDASGPALHEGARLWAAYLEGLPGECCRFTGTQTDLERIGHLRARLARQPRPFDLIILGNCLNETCRGARDPLAARAKLLLLLLDHLAPQGTLMIVEPALRTITRDLHALRDRLLADRACTVYSPCLHERACPALVRPDDWCHEDRLWSAPPWIVEMDGLVGFRKDSLKFAYLLLRKDGRTVAERGPTVYRVVSERRELKGETRAWLCNETGRPEVGRLDRERSKANAPVDDWHRGAIVRIDQIVRKDRKGREATVGRIPAEATVEVLRPV